MLNYLAHESVGPLIRNDGRRKAFNESVQRAVVLNNRYADLQREETILKTTNKMIYAHQQKLISENTGVYGTFMQTRYQLSDKEQQQKIQEWLNRLHQWSLKAYKEIMTFRSIITGGQTIIYHIMDAKRNIAYKFTEEQYLELLAANPPVLRWGSMKSIISKGKPLSDFFKLQVGDSSKNNTALQDVAKRTNAEIITSNMKKDALYNYLIQKNKISSGKDYRGKSNQLLHSRIFELYDQIKYSVKSGGWAKDKDGAILYPQNSKHRDTTGYFFSNQRRATVDNFIKKYTREKLNKDPITFYKTGDSIKNKNTLIENKIEGAVVSVSTIKNGIKNIASLTLIRNSLELYNKLVKTFTYAGDKGLTSAIQEGAERAAIHEINNTVFGRS